MIPEKAFRIFIVVQHWLLQYFYFKISIMKKSIIISLLVVLSLHLQLMAQNINELKTVSKIVVSSGILLEIERSDTYGLEIKSPDLNRECLINTIEEGVLTLKLKPESGCKGAVSASLKIPSIRFIEAANQAEVTTRNLLKTDSLILKLRTGAKASVDLDVTYLEIFLSEGSILTAEGYANIQNINVTTKATCSAFSLEGDTVQITASANALAKICATEKLDAKASMGAYIGYKCDPPQVKLDDSLLGKIEAVKED